MSNYYEDYTNEVCVEEILQELDEILEDAEIECEEYERLEREEDYALGYEVVVLPEGEVQYIYYGDLDYDSEDEGYETGEEEEEEEIEPIPDGCE